MDDVARVVDVAWSAVWLVVGELVEVDAPVVVVMPARVVEVSDGCVLDETVAVDEVESDDDSDDDSDLAGGNCVAVESAADEDVAVEGAAVVDVADVDVVVDELDSSNCKVGSSSSAAAEVGDADSMR